MRLKRFWAVLNSFDSMGMDRLRLYKIDLLFLSILLPFCCLIITTKLEHVY